MRRPIVITLNRSEALEARVLSEHGWPRRDTRSFANRVIARSGLARLTSEVIFDYEFGDPKDRRLFITDMRLRLSAPTPRRKKRVAQGAP